MKKIVLLLLMLSFVLPAFCASEDAQLQSIQYLNGLVKQRKLYKQVMRDTNSDYVKIKSLRTSLNSYESKNFGAECVIRNQDYLKSFKQEYFKPAYAYYRNLDKTNDAMTYQEWFDTSAMSEISDFYDFYTMVSQNLEDCKKLVTNQP